MSKKVNLVDYFICTVIIFIFTWNPNFAHGYIVGPDEGQQLAWINEILHGKTVYKEIYMFYGPLLEFMSIIFMKIFGISLWSLRLFYQVANMFNIILGFFILKLILRTRTFLYIGLWALLATRISDFWMPRWGGPRLMLGLCAVWLMLYYARREKSWALFLSGIFTGLALFTSQEIGIGLLFSSVLFLFFLSHYRFTFLYEKGSNGIKEIHNKSFAKNIFLYLTGFAIAASPFLIYLLTKGALSDYINICFIDLPLKYSRVFVEPQMAKLFFMSLFSNYQIPFPYNTSHFLYYLIAIFIYLVGIFYVILSSTVTHKLTRRNVILIFILLFGIPLLLSAFRQMIGEQLKLYSLPIVAVAIFLLERMFILGKDNLIIQRKKFNIKKLIIAILCLVVIQDVLLVVLIKSKLYMHMKDIFVTYMTLKDDPRDRFYRFTYTSMTPEEKYARISGDWQDLDLVRAKGIIVPKEQATAISEAVEFIRKNTNHDDEIFVFPHEGEYYFLADRASITRFTPAIYACIDVDYQKQIVTDLNYKKPRYCIYVKDAYVFTDYNKILNEKRLNLVFSYLKDNYFVKGQYGQTFILERKIP